MGMQQLTLPGEIVKKHNELVRSKIDIDSVQGSKVLACLIACINNNDREFKSIYRIAVKDILPDLGGGNYKQIKNICIELRKSGVDFEIRNPSGEPTFITVSFFSRIEYRKGIIEARFNTSDPLIANCLLNLRENFTKYNLIDYFKLPSIYSQRLFEILKSWNNMPEVIIKTDKLHQMLNTPPSFRSNFKALRIYVLEKAHKDITEKTPFRFEWEPIKAGRSVEAIRFLFAPGRKAITEAETKKAQEEKRRRLQNQRVIKALECAKAKGGECETQDNKRLVCKVCREFQFCEELRRKRA